MGYDEIWYQPVMPTPEEQRMIDAAKARIADQVSDDCDSGADNSAFSWRGFIIAILLALAITTVAIVVGWLATRG